MGDIITRPVVEFDLHVVMEDTVMLTIWTVGSEAERLEVVAEQRKPQALNALMSPDQCMKLSAKLAAYAQHILAQRTPPRSDRH